MDEATQFEYMAQMRPITFKDTIYFTKQHWFSFKVRIIKFCPTCQPLKVRRIIILNKLRFSTVLLLK